jgi:hypothetical protein
MTEKNRRYRLRRRPEGALISDADLELVEETVPAAGPGHALALTLQEREP